jgi:hypothetical protein
MPDLPPACLDLVAGVAGATVPAKFKPGGILALAAAKTV